MRTACIIIVGLGLTASGLGCYLCQHTAGVCDCDPPPVHYVLLPPPAPAPIGGMSYPIGAPAPLPPVPGPGVPSGPPAFGPLPGSVMAPPSAQPTPPPAVKAVPVAPGTSVPR